MLASTVSLVPQTHHGSAPLSSTSSHLVPSQPHRLTASSFQSPYFYRASGLAQIAVSALLRTSSADARKFSQRSTADTALEIYHQLKWGNTEILDSRPTPEAPRKTQELRR